MIFFDLKRFTFTTLRLPGRLHQGCFEDVNLHWSDRGPATCGPQIASHPPLISDCVSVWSLCGVNDPRRLCSPPLVEERNLFPPQGSIKCGRGQRPNSSSPPWPAAFVLIATKFLSMVMFLIVSREPETASASAFKHNPCHMAVGLNGSAGIPERQLLEITFLHD